MSSFFFKGIPAVRLAGFCAVRDSFDNLSNVLQLAELINTCSSFRVGGYDEKFDFVIFTGDYYRALVRKSDGYFSMTLPFQLIDNGETIAFNLDSFSEEINGRFISIMRNALLTARNGVISHEEIILSISDSFGMGVSDATHYYDVFAALIAEDHGYLRFDDDAKNANGDIHPRYHFDFFYKNTSSIKIGIDGVADIDCFYGLFDSARPKHYLGR